MQRGLAAALLLALLAASGVAHARMKAGPNVVSAHHRLRTPGGPLDGVSVPAAAAYSFRKLVSAYTGSAVKLRRTTGGTSDIGFTAGGDFDTAAATTFCAATTCFLDTWYDQSGNGAHLPQATPANQPAYVADCGAGKPCARNTLGTGQGMGLAGVTPAGVTSISTVARQAVRGSGNCVELSDNLNQVLQQVTDFATLSNNSVAFNAPSTGLAWHAHIGVMNGAASVLAVDGTETAGTVTGVTTGGALYFVGGTGSTCDNAEMVLWRDYALSPAERTALTQNQRNYWIPQVVGIANPAAAYSFRKIVSIYGGPAVKLRRTTGGTQDIGFAGNDFDSAAAATFCAATTCFLDTWYDQSSNARHMVQATPANQPAYVADCGDGKPCLRTTLGSAQQVAFVSLASSATFTISLVAKTQTRGSGECGYAFINNNFMNPSVDSIGLSNGSASFFMPAATTVWHAYIGVFAGASSLIRVDAAETTGSVAPKLPPISWAVYGGTGATCDEREWALWDNYILTAGERAALQTNQKSFWGTP